MKPRFCKFIFAILCACLNTTSAATEIASLTTKLNIDSGLASVWAMSDAEKVLLDETNHAYKAGSGDNLIYDGNTIKLKGLRNEVLAFQIITEAGKDGAKELRVEIDNPRYTTTGKYDPTGRMIGDDGVRYGNNGMIEIFTQHYHMLTSRSSFGGDNWTYPEATTPTTTDGKPIVPTSAKPVGIPDALIPSNRALAGKGGFPVAVAANKNQGFWVDMYLPRNKTSYPAGKYIGAVHVYNGHKLARTIQLELDLLDAEMSDDTPTTTLVYVNMEYYYNCWQKQKGCTKEFRRSDIEKMMKFEAKRHRVELVGGFMANSATAGKATQVDEPVWNKATQAYNKLPWEEVMKRYKPWLTGKGYTASNGYYGPGLGQPDKYFFLHMYNAGHQDSEMDEMTEEGLAEAKAWESWFKNNAPRVKYIWYNVDEPWVNSQGAKQIKKQAAWLKKNGVNLPMASTVAYPGVSADLRGSLDFMMSTTYMVNKNDKDYMNANNYAFYNGTRPFSGSMFIDGAATDLRTRAWIQYAYGIPTSFLWHGTIWSSQHESGVRLINVWKNPSSFIWGLSQKNKKPRPAYGDGLLFYPGTTKIAVARAANSSSWGYAANAHQATSAAALQAEDRGLTNEVITSIRLKQLRRGQQDVVILNKVGASAEKVVGSFSNMKVFSNDLSNKNRPISWEERGVEYERIVNAAREKF